MSMWTVMMTHLETVMVDTGLDTDQARGLIEDRGLVSGLADNADEIKILPIKNFVKVFFFLRGKKRMK